MQDSLTSFNFLKDLRTETGVAPFHIPVFRIHIKVGTLAQSVMIDSHHIRIRFAHYVLSPSICYFYMLNVRLYIVVYCL